MAFVRNARLAAFVHDLSMIPLAWMGAYWLRYNLEISAISLAQAVPLLPWVIILQAVSFWVFGLYRGVWRFASVPDLMRILKSIIFGSALILAFAFFLHRFDMLPRSVLPLYALLMLVCLGGSRFGVRWLKDTHHWFRVGQRVLIVGAGGAGESLARELLREKETPFLPVAFVDTLKTREGSEIHGIRVVGTIADIPQVVRSFKIDLIMLAVTEASAVEMRQVVENCEVTGKPVRTLPPLFDLVRGSVTLKHLRDVRLEDLLGRKAVALDAELIAQSLSDRIVLVTGGGGSIGSELCRQIITHQPRLLLVADHSEYNLFNLMQEFSEMGLTVPVHYYLLDIRDEALVRRYFQQHRPHVVFHAAAYKHVPLLEPQVRSAVNNNVMGTKILADCALEYGAEKFILVSSDKAVYPTNVMGATKRLAEHIILALNAKGKTKFITVRFGNVLGSKGSVIEIFQKQLEKGGPLTVTDPRMTRYFMTIAEASLLILQAMSMGEGGEVFVLDMGQPVRISYLAEQMIRLAGKKVGEEIKIVYVGLRPGEKLSEELSYDKESLLATKHPKIRKTQLTGDFSNLQNALQEINSLLQSASDQELLIWLQHRVPEFNTVSNILRGERVAEVV